MKFFSEENYATEVRKAKPELLDKDDLKRIAMAINLDEEGQPGRVQQKILSVDDPTKYIAFFCHFKVLFKLVQIGLSKKRQANLQRKLDANTKQLSDNDKQIDTEELAIENLSVHHLMAKEAQRLRTTEIQFLNGKKSSLEKRIADLKNKSVVSEVMKHL